MPWRRPSDRTEIVHIVVTGYHKKSSPRKHYVFVIDVSWNNNERYEIYRRYSDFFSFQTQLKMLFPVAAGRRNEERTIPQLPKRIFVGRSHVARVAEARVEQINRYCQTLISLEPKVSESSHVVGYFSPRVQDKQLPKLHLHRPASLYPLNIPAGSLFQEYCALADYHAEESSQVTFKAGDKVLVMSKDDSGWWMCECHGRVGWAPPSYLKSSTPDSDSDSDQEEFLGLPESYSDPSETDSVKSGGSGFHLMEIEAEEYTAIDCYEPEGEGQIRFEMGDTIHVLDKLEDGWWFVSAGEEEGWAPCSYLEKQGQELPEDETISSLDIEKYTTKEPYTAEEDDELSFGQGVLVDVLQKSLDGWWLVKLENACVGLAPATLLKKIDLITDSNQIPVRKVTPPPQLQFAPKPFQQPPRKQSVRYRASLKGKAAKSNLSQIQETEATPSSPESGIESPSPRPPRSPRTPPGGLHCKIGRFESSEDKPPVPPRPARPPVSPKPHKMKQKSLSSDDIVQSTAPSKPSRPSTSELERVHTNIPMINEQLLTEEQPKLPFKPQRPRHSEIRRAQSRSPSPGAANSETAVLNGSARHTKSRSNSAADIPTALVPPLPERSRRRSEGETHSSGEVSNGIAATQENPINQQMADTLIKYILASNDPSLKLALRNIITSDPQVLKTLNEE